MKKFIKAVLVLIAAAAVVIMVSSLYTVKENEYAVVMQFGKITKVESEPGLKIKIPFVQTRTIVPKAVQLYDIAPSDVITKDKKSMIADTYIMWQVTDPIKFAQTLNCSIVGAQDRTSVAVYNATKNIISSMSQDEIIAARGEKLTSLITSDANESIGGYGIVITKAEIKSLDLPEDNKEAVYERMISERNNIAASYEAEGKAEEQKIQNETDREVTVMKAEAEKQAAILEAEGETAYMQKLQEAYDSEDKADFYNFIRSLDALKTSIQGGNKTIILDKESPIAQLFYRAY